MIAPIKYMSILCMKEDRDKLVESLQRCGEVMIEDTDVSVRNASSSADMLRRIEKLREGIKPFIPKRPLFAEIPQVDSREFEIVSQSNLQKAAEMEKLLSEIAAKTASNAADRELMKQLSPWYDLSIPLEELGDSEYVSFIPGFVPSKKSESLINAVKDNIVGIDIVSEYANNAYVVVSVIKGENLSELAEYGFERITFPPVKGMAREIVTELKSKTEETEKEITVLREKLAVLAAEGSTADLLYEQYKAKSERETVPVAETIETVLIEGWVPEDRISKVEKALHQTTEICDIIYRDPLPGENVPTSLRSSRIVSQFESITNMFSVPSYGGTDPNGVMAPWYWVIFGLMMADVGYGALMAIFGFALKKLMKPKGVLNQIINIILLSSITTVLAGILFGSYFGETWNPILFSPINDPTKMLIFTMLVGVAHIFTGLTVKIIENVRFGKMFDAICDQVSWMLVITGLGLVFVPSLKIVGMVAAIIGALIVLFTAGRTKKNIIGKAVGGLVALYGISGYFSDILSYSRILALGLATGVVGMVMNMLARMVQGPWWGYIASLLIYVVGHVFNLALGLLSAYVHDCRLQYIEFYGKFYEGNGRLFKAFSIEPKLINVKQQNGGN